MTDIQGFKKADELTWLDVSDELFRVYVYPSGYRYTVYDPLKLSVKQKPEGDSHRIQLKTGGVLYVRPGWVAIEWTVKTGALPVAF